MSGVMEVSSLDRNKYVLNNFCDLYFNLLSNKNKSNEVEVISLFNEFFDKNDILNKDKENIISTYFLLKASYELSINKNIENAVSNAIESIDKQFSIENSKRIFNILSLSDCYNFDEFFLTSK